MYREVDLKTDTKINRNIEEHAHKLLQQGWKVFCGIPGWNPPPEINGKVPSLFAMKDDVEKIVEIASFKTSRTSLFLLKKTAFEMWSSQNPRRRKFEIVIKA